MITFEAWDDDGDITFAPRENIREQIEKGLLSRSAKKVYEIQADSYEEAMIKHYQKMNWGSYKPN